MSGPRSPRCLSALRFERAAEFVSSLVFTDRLCGRGDYIYRTSGFGRRQYDVIRDACAHSKAHIFRIDTDLVGQATERVFAAGTVAALPERPGGVCAGRCADHLRIAEVFCWRTDVSAITVHR